MQTPHTHDLQMIRLMSYKNITDEIGEAMPEKWSLWWICLSPQQLTSPYSIHQITVGTIFQYLVKLSLCLCQSGLSATGTLWATGGGQITLCFNKTKFPWLLSRNHCLIPSIRCLCYLLMHSWWCKFLLCKLVLIIRINKYAKMMHF